jgi:signal transduction histidine kinase
MEEGLWQKCELVLAFFRTHSAENQSSNSMQTAQSNQPVPLGRPTSHKLSEFLASFPCVSYELDENFIVQTVSSNVLDLLGIQQECLLGRRALWHERLFPADRERLMTRLHENTAPTFVSEIHRIINDSGLPVWVSHSFWKIQTRHHTSVRGTLVPLTREVRSKFVETETITQFIHKIGNHFQLINLLIGSIRRNQTPGNELDTLEKTVECAVDFTRSFSNFCQVPVHLSAVNLGEILLSATQSVAPLFAEKNVQFNFKGERILNEISVLGDSSLLEPAFFSLLENAGDATKPGDVVTVDSKSELSGSMPSSIAWISIIDTGCGMNKDVLEKASAPFFSSKRDRNGLGLSMAIRVLEMHGGLINISSEENYGTRLDIVLPVCSSGDSER